MQAHAKNTVRAIERGANTRLITKIAYRDFGRTVLAHGIDLTFIFCEAANRGAPPDELRYHEARELAGRAYRQYFGSDAHRALIPQSIEGQANQRAAAGSRLGNYSVASQIEVVRSRALSRQLQVRLFFNGLRR
jgi:hypothetical protein